MTKNVGEQPQIHSNAEAGPDGRLHAASAARNVGPILDALAGFVPPKGCALELASGTGEHVLACADRFPELTWQPTDIAPDRLASIDAWRAVGNPGNLLAAQFLDAAGADWQVDGFDLVITINLFHLISRPAALNVIKGAARALHPGGRFFIYGPFRSEGAFRSDADAAFHAQLTGSDAAIGYKDLEWMFGTCADFGLARSDLVEMPANNLALVTQMMPG